MKDFLEAQKMGNVAKEKSGSGCTFPRKRLFDNYLFYILETGMKSKS